MTDFVTRYFAKRALVEAFAKGPHRDEYAAVDALRAMAGLDGRHGVPTAKSVADAFEMAARLRGEALVRRASAEAISGETVAWLFAKAHRGEAVRVGLTTALHGARHAHSLEAAERLFTSIAFMLGDDRFQQALFATTTTHDPPLDGAAVVSLLVQTEAVCAARYHDGGGVRRRYDADTRIAKCARFTAYSLLSRTRVFRDVVACIRAATTATTPVDETGNGDDRRQAHAAAQYMAAVVSAFVRGGFRDAAARDAAHALPYAPAHMAVYGIDTASERAQARRAVEFHLREAARATSETQARCR